MTDFASRQTARLLASALPPPSTVTTPRTSETKQRLQAALISLNPPIDPGSSAVKDALTTLSALHTRRPVALHVSDDEEVALKTAIMARVAVALYAEAIHRRLIDAAEAEVEAEWWSDNTRSQYNTFMYLIPSEHQFRRMSRV
jgi:nuclear control of ATPase protein 2